MLSGSTADVCVRIAVNNLNAVMVKGGGPRKSDTPVAPARESGEAIAKSVAQSPNVRRNCPWTEAEHKLFLLGLEEFGRGNWRDIAARYVSTRTPTQVASHAQKYFLREGLPASRKEKRRPSIHDIRSATEAPVMTPDERAKLRNSLQLINRSSMESIDTSALEGRQGFRHSTGAAFGRNYSRNHTLETGSSGEVSTGAGDKNAYMTVCEGSRRESISDEEPFLRPAFPCHGKDSSDGFPEVPEGEEVKPMPTLPPTEQCASWHTSSLFAPVQILPSQHPSHEPPCSKPVTAADRNAHMFRQGSFEVMPSGSANMMLLGTSLHGGVMPEQAAMMPHAHSFADLLQQPHNPLAGPGLPGHTANNSNNSSGRIGLPEEFPAAYPLWLSFGDEPASCVYNDGLSMSDVPPCVAHAGCIPNQFGWGGMGGFGGHGPLSLGCKSGAGQSDTVYGSDCDQLNTGPARTSTHSDFAPALPTSPAPAVHHHPNVYVMPNTMLDRSQSQNCANGSSGMDLYGSHSLPVALPSGNFQQPQPFPQERYMHNVQHMPTAQVASDPLFGSGPTEEAAFSYCPSIEDFRALALSCGNDDLLVTTARDRDPLIGTTHDPDVDIMM